MVAQRHHQDNKRCDRGHAAADNDFPRGFAVHTRMLRGLVCDARVGRSRKLACVSFGESTEQRVTLISAG
jgi:hypothetical protein